MAITEDVRWSSNLRYADSSTSDTEYAGVVDGQRVYTVRGTADEAGRRVFTVVRHTSDGTELDVAMRGTSLRKLWHAKEDADRDYAALAGEQGVDVAAELRERAELVAYTEGTGRSAAGLTLEGLRGFVAWHRKRAAVATGHTEQHPVLAEQTCDASVFHTKIAHLGPIGAYRSRTSALMRVTCWGHADRAMRRGVQLYPADIEFDHGTALAMDGIKRAAEATRSARRRPEDAPDAVADREHAYLRTDTERREVRPPDVEVTYRFVSADLANARAAGAVLLRQRDRWQAEAEQAAERLDGLIDKLQALIPEDWESSEGSAESIVVEFTTAAVARLTALVGESGLARYPEDVNGAPLPDAATDPAGYRIAAGGPVISLAAYGCSGCSFTTTHPGRMDGHARATGHEPVAAPPGACADPSVMVLDFQRTEPGSLIKLSEITGNPPLQAKHVKSGKCACGLTPGFAAPEAHDAGCSGEPL